jgi:uncharacterized protein YbbK (DUF523 family)
MNTQIKKILVSGCLGGARIRYNETGVDMNDSIWQRWHEEGRLVYFCPEIAAGFPIPRPAAEAVGGSAADVLAGDARVMEDTGRDVTELFITGAELAVEAALREDVALAILTDGSPSCGSTFVYSGNFDNKTKPGRGLVAELFERAGIRVFQQTDLHAAEAFLRSERFG